MPTSKPGSVDELWPFIRNLRYPVLTTRRADGRLRSRPVAMQNSDSESLDFLWLFTQRNAGQVEDLQWDTSASIVFAEAQSAACVAVFGSAAVIGDISRKESLWSHEAGSCFAGPDDPGLALLRVRIVQADHWDVEKNSATRIFRLDDSTLPFRITPDRGRSGAIHR